MNRVTGLALLWGLMIGLAYLAGSAPLVLMAMLGAAAVVCSAILAKRRIGRNLRLAGQPVGSVNWELALFPLVVSVRQSSLVTIGLLAALIVALLLTRRSASRMNPLPLYLLTASGVVALGLSLDATLLIFCLAAGFLWLAASRVERADALPSLRAGIVIYLLANIGGHFGGIPSPLDHSRLGGYATSSALFAERVAFPFARAINEPSTVAAVFVGLVLAGFMTGRKVRLLDWVGVGAAVFVMLASNSRSPVMVAAAFGIVTLIFPALVRRLGLVASLAISAAPFLLTFYTPAINAAASALASSRYLARGQSAEDIAGLGTRVEIWQGLLNFWGQLPLGRGAWLGFGQNGHATSGANAGYTQSLGGFLADKTNLTAHNSLLQQLFDGGVVGLGLLLAGILVAGTRLAQSNATLPQLVTVCTLAVAAAGESFLSPGFTTTPFFILLYIAAFSPAMAGVPRKCEPSTPRRLVTSPR